MQLYVANLLIRPMILFRFILMNAQGMFLLLSLSSFFKALKNANRLVSSPLPFFLPAKNPECLLTAQLDEID